MKLLFMFPIRIKDHYLVLFETCNFDLLTIDCYGPH